MSQIGVPDHTEVQRARVAQCNTVKNGCSTRVEGFPSRVAGCGAIGKGESTRPDSGFPASGFTPQVVRVVHTAEPKR